MKRNICILLVFIFLISLSVVDLIFVNKTFKNMTSKVDALSTAIETNDKAKLKKQADEIETYWIKSEKKLTLFLYYRDIDTLGKQVDLVCTLVQNEQLSDAKTEVKSLQYLLQSASKVYEFNLDNLL